MPGPQLILASASPRRRELLEGIGLHPLVAPSDSPELHDPHLTARELCMINAHRKARAVAGRYPAHSVVAADTLVYLGTTLYGKPTDRADAGRMLAELAGHTHSVVTGVCLMCQEARREKLFADTTLVTFRPLSAEKIEKYLAQINPLDKAGGYAIQEHGELIIERVRGSYSNVVGLPLEKFQEVWQRWNERI